MSHLDCEVEFVVLCHIVMWSGSASPLSHSEFRPMLIAVSHCMDHSKPSCMIPGTGAFPVPGTQMFMRLIQFTLRQSSRDVHAANVKSCQMCPLVTTSRMPYEQTRAKRTVKRTQLFDNLLPIKVCQSAPRRPRRTSVCTQLPSSFVLFGMKMRILVGEDSQLALTPNAF